MRVKLVNKALDKIAKVFAQLDTVFLTLELAFSTAWGLRDEASFDQQKLQSALKRTLFSHPESVAVLAKSLRSS